jgi:hypothetical protein
VRNIASSWPARSAEIGRAGSQIALHCTATPVHFHFNQKSLLIDDGQRGA